MTHVSDFRRAAAWLTAFLVAVTILAPLAGPAGAIGTFDDDDGNIHESAIEKIAALGITRGCNPPTNNLYCPDDYVTREQMASFLVRAFELPAAASAGFTDTSTSVHRADIDALAASGITRGCNPPTNDRYCPTQHVTRGQMAAFMARGLGLANVSEDYFDDDNGNIFEGQINAIARIGITRGCNPPANNEYCPDNRVRRDEMASFLSRVVDILTTGTTITTPPGTTPTTPPTTAPPTTLVPGGPCYTDIPEHALIVGNPLINEFTGNAGGLCDKGTIGTGFTWLDEPSNGTGYIRSNLHVTGGELRVTSTSGLFDTSSNSQDNALSVPLNPQVTYMLETGLVSPPSGTSGPPAGFEQAGLWFGNDEDNYVKVVYLTTTSGPAVQIRAEIDGVGSGPAPVPLGSQPGNLELRLQARVQDTTVVGSYRVNGGAWTQIGSIPDLPIGLWTIDQAGTTTNTFGGILTSHRNGPSPQTFRFSKFSATGTVATVDCPPATGFDCVKFPVGYKPTSMEWYGERLYVLGVDGSVNRYSMAANGTLQPDGSWSKLPPAPSGTTYTALGMAIQPGSSTASPTVWIASSRSGGNNFLEGVANSSTVWRITNIAGSGTTSPQITGLPRAYENHAINSIRFHEGELYIMQGGNTGGGSANDQPESAFGTRAEQPLSAAWLRADVLNGWSPTGDGNCATAVNDGPPPNNSETTPNMCSVEVVATGLRNSYDFVFHRNGNVYAADNGLGVVGTVPTSTCGDWVGDPLNYQAYDPGPQVDRLHILEEGAYYGHPNPTRDECVFMDGSFQTALYGSTVNPPANYKPAHQYLNRAGPGCLAPCDSRNASPRSLNSIIEYKGTAAAGQIANGDLLISAFAGTAQGLFRISPNDSCPDTQSAWNGGVSGCLTQVGGTSFDIGSPLGLVQASDGRLVIGEWVTRQSPSSFLIVLTPN